MTEQQQKTFLRVGASSTQMEKLGEAGPLFSAVACVYASATVVGPVGTLRALLRLVSYL